jgi:hypothetical protein
VVVMGVVGIIGGRRAGIESNWLGV